MLSVWNHFASSRDSEAGNYSLSESLSTLSSSLSRLKSNFSRNIILDLIIAFECKSGIQQVKWDKAYQLVEMVRSSPPLLSHVYISHWNTYATHPLNYGSVVEYTSSSSRKFIIIAPHLLLFLDTVEILHSQNKYLDM